MVLFQGILRIKTNNNSIYVSFLAKEAVAEGKNPVIIDNTNTQAWEMRFYVELVRMESF